MTQLDTPTILYSLRKTRLFRRLLIKGISFSIFFHIGLFLLFQIKRIPHMDTVSSPSTVFLSQIDPSITILSPKKPQDEDPRQKYAREFGLDTSFVPDQIAPLIPTALVASTTSHNESALIHPLLPWTFSDEYAPSAMQCRVYPIKITLHSSLRHLSFIDDGSLFFKKSSPQTLLHAPIFAQATPKVNFNVDISPITGKITKSVCTKEPFDKRLQEIASRILQKIQFHTGKSAFRKNIWTGEISLQFYGTFETITSLIETEELR